MADACCVLSQHWNCCICLKACAYLQIRSRQAHWTLLSPSVLQPRWLAAGLGVLRGFSCSCPNHLSPAAAGPRPRRGDSLPADTTERHRSQTEGCTAQTVAPTFFFFFRKSNTTHIVPLALADNLKSAISRSERRRWQQLSSSQRRANGSQPARVEHLRE